MLINKKKQVVPVPIINDSNVIGPVSVDVNNISLIEDCRQPGSLRAKTFFRQSIHYVGATMTNYPTMTLPQKIRI
jgi:hypothetical protein